MSINGIYEYIAKQLFDHKDQDHGVRQNTYTSWKEHHIIDAVQLAIDYLYSIHPKAFPTQVKTMKQPKTSCIIDFTCVACKVLEVIRIGDKQCDNITNQSADEVNSLLPMLDLSCVGEQDPELKQYTIRNLADDKYIADSEIPKGTEIDYLCASPIDADDLPTNLLREYSSLITSFALWQLLLTDNESISNQPRWAGYFEALRLFVETKLLMEFSLKEDDYLLGRRRVDDK